MVVLAFGSGATLAAPRYPRTQPVPEPVTLSERVRPTIGAQGERQGQGQGQAPGQAQPSKPRIDMNALLDTEMPVGAIRAEQEQILAELISSTPDSDVDEKSDYYFRLGTMYSQQVRFWTAKGAETQRLIAATTDPAARAKLQQEATSASNQTKTYLLKAVKVFKGLTDNDAFRNYPKLDMALFQYGFTLQQGKYMKEARAVYDKLLKNFPNSQYVPTAHLVFGEYYFDAGQLADAEARYKMVLKFPKSNLYWYAFYKLGWVHMNAQRYQEALESFFQVVAASRNDAKKKSLHDAARGDFVIAYAQVGKLDKAYEVFARIDKAAAGDLVLALADAARDRGEAEKALASYKQLLAKEPTDGRACQWQYRAAHASFSVPGIPTDKRIAEVEALVAHYVRIHQAAAAEGTNEDEECREDASAMAGELADAYHADWAKTRSPEALGAAERLYAAYATAFPTDAIRNTALGEVRWSLALEETNPTLLSERWARAALAFGLVGSFDGERAASLAWMNKLDYVAPPAGPFKLARAPGRVAKPLPFKGHDAATVEMFTAFVEHATTAQPSNASAAPDVAAQAARDNELVQVRLALATLLRTYKRFDEATDVLDKLLADHPTHHGAEYAANLLLDSMVQAKSADLPIVVGAMIADRAFVDTKPHLLKNLMALRQRVR
jgi:tetratricopeptide (TPR) repeat protein